MKPRMLPEGTKQMTQHDQILKGEDCALGAASEILISSRKQISPTFVSRNVGV